MSECRICACTDAIFLNIFHKNDTRKYDVEINTCLPIKVTTDDVISLKICHVCVHKLELCNEFVCHFLTTESQRQKDSRHNVCYLCLENKGILSSLFDGNFNWIHQIETALGCKVHRGKRVSSKICHHCAYKLGELYNLFQSALDSESKLYMMCEFPKASNQNQNFGGTDTKALKNSMKINQQPMQPKSLGSVNTIIRVAARKVNPTDARNTVSTHVLSNSSPNLVKVMVPHQIDSSVKSKDKQIGISHQVLEGRTTRKGSSVPKIKEKSKLKTAAKDDKATLKSVDNIQVACWKCFRDLKDNEMCSCSVDFEGSVKTKKADRKVNISVSSNDVAPFIKTEVSVRNKRKRENEDFGNNNSKKVRDDVKKPVQKRRESVPLVSHVYDIRRTKRKRTITDYNQLLNDGLLLSPRADRGKKDVKSIPKNTPIKEASKTTAISKHSITMSAKRNSRKSTDRKLENQENVPQKTTALETSKLNAVHARDMQRKKASPKSTASKLSPKRRVPKKLQQHEISSEGDLVEEQVPPEKLNKYECSVCSTQFPSTVEGKFHEVAHTAREMKLIMYRYRSSDQSSSSKQSQKNARKTENDTEIGGITKEIKKVLQDVVSKVSEDPLNKIQNVNGHNITRTRTGRIVVSKLQIKKVSRVARNKGRRSAADILKSDETVRSIISDFESLEEKEEVEEEPSLTTVVEESGTPALGTMDVDERIRKNSSEEDLKENHNGPEVAVDEQVDHLTDDLNPENHIEDFDSENRKGESSMSNTAAVPASEGDSQDYLNGEVCKLGSGPGEVDGNSDDRLGTKGTQKVSECSDVVSDENEDTGVGNTGRNDGEELDKVATEVDKVPPLVQIEEDIDEEKAPGSSGGNSDVIVEETPLSTGTGPRCAGLDNSTYDMHTSIEKEIYELHGVENVNLTPPKDNGAVDSVINLEHTESDKVSTTSNETDLIQILE